MSQNLVHYSFENKNYWGVLFGEKIAPLSKQASTTGEVLDKHWDAIWALTSLDAKLLMREVTLLSPVTQNQQFICQGINYASHVKESGLDITQIPFNTLFTKAGSSITSADAPVVCPSHVKLLDYEVELGLVVRQAPPVGKVVGPNDLHRYLAGVTIVNDLSARDVQLPQGQFYKGKSYRGFGPVGPYIALLSKDEWQRWPLLRMRLSVNGNLRQDAYCGEMIHKPAATLSELGGLQDIFSGDLIATGTPAGCAVRAPGKVTMFIVRHFISEAAKWKMMSKKGIANPAYLRAGDQLEVAISTDDGSISLGKQTTRIIAPI
jgi:2,4-didehydro-3-deoxy-L-rhamnonate hydrolase